MFAHTCYKYKTLSWRENDPKSSLVCRLSVSIPDRNDHRTVLIFFYLRLFTLPCALFFPSPFQAWADAFRSSPDLTGVVQVYEELKRKGIEFPTSDLETLSPIHTPQRVGDSSSSTQNPKCGFLLLFLELFIECVNVGSLCWMCRNLYCWYLCKRGLCTNQSNPRNNYI